MVHAWARVAHADTAQWYGYGPGRHRRCLAPRGCFAAAGGRDVHGPPDVPASPVRVPVADAVVCHTRNRLASVHATPCERDLSLRSENPDVRRSCPRPVADRRPHPRPADSSPPQPPRLPARATCRQPAYRRPHRRVGTAARPCRPTSAGVSTDPPHAPARVRSVGRRWGSVLIGHSLSRQPHHRSESAKRGGIGSESRMTWREHSAAGSSEHPHACAVETRQGWLTV